MYEGGIANMDYSVSNNAEFGQYWTGPKVIGKEAREAMENCIKDIQTGVYAKAFLEECSLGYPVLRSMRNLTARHPIETTGAKLRAMMPFIAANKLVDRSKN